MKAASVSDYRELARRRLPKFIFEYVDGGSYDEVTLARNVEDLRAIRLRQRVLRDISKIDLASDFFGQPSTLPVALAPVGIAGMLARRGEVQAVRAAEAKGVPYTLSTVSLCSIEEVRKASAKPFWFQLYMIRDRAFMRDLLQRAREAGSTVLVFTVDLPVPGSRYRDSRSGLSNARGPKGMARRVLQAAGKPAWAWDVGVNGAPHKLGNLGPVLGNQTGLEDFFRWMRGAFDPSVTWRDLDWVRSEWKGPLILKGILDVEDARVAVSTGADGIVVSNHGGRQLDGAVSSAVALPRIADAVGSSTRILADGGVRSGLDVVRMLALGASGVLLGRAWAYALGGGGQAGVKHILDLVEAEMRVAMALTGVSRLADINRSILDI